MEPILKVSSNHMGNCQLETGNARVMETKHVQNSEIEKKKHVKTTETKRTNKQVEETMASSFSH